MIKKNVIIYCQDIKKILTLGKGRSENKTLGLWAFCLALHPQTAKRGLLCSRLSGIKDRKYSLPNEIKNTVLLYISSN